jgi:formylglycine-generating enzyme required for sulfatase activity
MHRTIRLVSVISILLPLYSSPASSADKPLVPGSGDPSSSVANGNVKSGRQIRDCAECPEMVVIPSGSFIMGALDNTTGQLESEGPAHLVHLDRFAIGRTEVTRAQWRHVMGNDPSYFKNCGATCPVEQVSWNDAQAFVKKLSSMTGHQYKLPSEAQWEYACRAGARHGSCGSNVVDEVAWYESNSQKTTHPVALKAPNDFGLFDMNGNVAEWVEDCMHDDYRGAPTDGSAWVDRGCRERVLRGAAWNAPKPFVRAGERFGYEPSMAIFFLGFRVVRIAAATD